MNVLRLSSRASLTVLLAVAVVGCKSTAKPQAEVASAMPPATDALGDSKDASSSTMLASSTSPAGTQAAKPVFFTDKPELQEGTGPMDPDVPTEFLRTESGLRYRILRQSTGPKPKLSDTVVVNYRGWLSNGKVFDSSYDRGQTTSFALDSVIAGWTEGMQLIGVGGMIELWVPSRLGYGATGSPGAVLPHSTLHFVVELVRVK